MDLRTIGRCDSPLIVDRSPPVAGIVNDGEIHGVDLDFTKYEDKVHCYITIESLNDTEEHMYNSVEFYSKVDVFFNAIIYFLYIGVTDL